jgi:tetratricopeptide (TPR) repeat protein
MASLLTLVLIAVSAAAGTYGYAVREWRRAEAAVRDGRPDEANKHLGICLRLWPDSPEVHQLAARAARQSGDFVTAESHLNTCLRLENGASENTQLEFLLMRGQSGEIDEVAPLLMDYVERQHPDTKLILETIALVYIYHLRYGPAFYYLKRWIEHAPESAKAHHYRGWVLERMDQPKGALESYLHALELDPNLDRVRLRVAEMYLEEKQPLSALPHLKILLDRNPDRPESLARMGQCKFLQGEPIEARRLLERALPDMPKDSAVLLYLARLDMAEQQPVRAEERLRKALELDPSDTEAQFGLVTALQLQKRDAEAAAALAEYDRQRAQVERANKLLQEEARRQSRDPQSAYEIGALLLSIGHDRQGLHWMDEALNRDPNHRPTHQALAEYFEKNGNRERAAYHRRRLLK